MEIFFDHIDDYLIPDLNRIVCSYLVDPLREKINRELKEEFSRRYHISRIYNLTEEDYEIHMKVMLQIDKYADIYTPLFHYIEERSGPWVQYVEYMFGIRYNIKNYDRQWFDLRLKYDEIDLSRIIFDNGNNNKNYVHCTWKFNNYDDFCTYKSLKSNQTSIRLQQSTF